MRYSIDQRTSIDRAGEEHTSAERLAFTTTVDAHVVDTCQAGKLTLWEAHAALQLRIATRFGGAHAVDKDKRSLAGRAYRQCGRFCAVCIDSVNSIC
jgi:hypothetical protein